MAAQQRTFAFSVGGIVGSSFKIWGRNLLPFTVLAALIFSPLIVYTVILMGSALTKKDFQTYSIVMFYGSSILGFIATGAITYGVVRQLQGEPASIGASIGVGLGRLLPVLGVGIMVGLIVFLGSLLLVIPGIYWMCTYYVAVPVAVIEKAGGSDSLRRSKELTKGNLGNIFAVVLLFGLLGLAVGLAVDRFVVGEIETLAQTHRSMVLNLVQTILFAGGLGPVANALIYYELRRAKEGVSLDELAKVFE